MDWRRTERRAAHPGRMATTTPALAATQPKQSPFLESL